MRNYMTGRETATIAGGGLLVFFGVLLGSGRPGKNFRRSLSPLSINSWLSDSSTVSYNIALGEVFVNSFRRYGRKLSHFPGAIQDGFRCDFSVMRN